MGSSLGCFGDDDNDTVCYSLVGAAGSGVVLLVAALIALCCVCFKLRKTE